MLPAQVTYHFDLDKVKKRLTEYLAVIHLHPLVAQEVKMEQAEAQGFVLKDPIEVFPRRLCRSLARSPRGLSLLPTLRPAHLHPNLVVPVPVFHPRSSLHSTRPRRRDP